MSLGALIRGLATLLIVASGTQSSAPNTLLGSWTIGVPYNTKPPVGINARQEAHLRRLRLVFTKSHFSVCGRELSIKMVTQRRVTEDEFLQERGFMPSQIGFRTQHVIEIEINRNSFGACGQYNDPGTDLITDDAGKHVVMEVANDYLPLKRE
jgi:hypothetical protein